MNSLLQKLGINERFTKNYVKQLRFNKIYNNIPHKANCNQMADLLHLPTTRQRFKYLLVVVDLATRCFDVEPIKDKTAPTVLAAMLRMYRRPYIKQPAASLTTDGGTEFGSVFHKYLYNKNILQKIAMPYRHKQLSTVESLNKQLGRLLNGYMNAKEEETGRNYNEWTDVLPTIREDLNALRKRNMPADPLPPLVVPNIPDYPKYSVGDVVHYKLDYPVNAMGDKQPTANFRMGDYRWSPTSHRIYHIIMMSDAPYWRYLLEGVAGASFSEHELIKSDETTTTFRVKKILDKKKERGRIYYKVWWQRELKKDATWEPRAELIKDGLKHLLDEFDSQQ
jgi:hypothetical protein